MRDYASCHLVQQGTLTRLAAPLSPCGSVEEREALWRHSAVGDASPDVEVPECVNALLIAEAIILEVGRRMLDTVPLPPLSGREML